MGKGNLFYVDHALTVCVYTEYMGIYSNHSVLEKLTTHSCLLIVVQFWGWEIFCSVPDKQGDHRDVNISLQRNLDASAYAAFPPRHDASALTGTVMHLSTTKAMVLSLHFGSCVKKSTCLKPRTRAALSICCVIALYNLQRWLRKL